MIDAILGALTKVTIILAILGILGAVIWPEAFLWILINLLARSNPL